MNERTVYTPTPPFKEGDRIQLDFMSEDPDPLPPGSQGTVEFCTYLSTWKEWQVSVKWDSGRSLLLIMPKDHAHKLPSVAP